MVGMLQVFSVFQILCLGMDLNDLILPSLGPGEVMPHFSEQQTEVREHQELALDVKVDHGRTTALIQVCLTP